jgi:hypothetical protein
VSDEPARNADLDELNSSLNEGLKSCHAVISNYRALLAADQRAVASNTDAKPDEKDGSQVA